MFHITADPFTGDPAVVATLALAGADNVVLWLQAQNEAAILRELEALAAEVFG
ncbi:MAG TPA: hypothetical protein PJ986_17465 [Gammaproteobacteria bacterium]|nr:hypothetical protein [Gammaproteobacteria bacterium]